MKWKGEGKRGDRGRERVRERVHKPMCMRERERNDERDLVGCRGVKFATPKCILGVRIVWSWLFLRSRFLKKFFFSPPHPLNCLKEFR